MKILHLLQSNRFSGAENVVCQIVNMFKEQPDIEMVYCSRDGQIREALAERGVTFVPLEKLSFSEVKRVIKEQKPDIIHAHDVTASILASVAGMGIKVISHMHVNHENMSKLNFKTISYLISALKYKHIFWVSDSSYNNYIFKKALSKKSSVLYNVMDKKSIYEKMEMDSDNYPYDIVYVGRLTHQKNPERLIKVAGMVADRIPEVKIGIAGTGDLLEPTKKLAEECNIMENVEFLGFKENPLKMLKDSKVMVMTSRFEGTPMTALESMALGTPIVSTPTDGMLDLIDDGVNGYLSDDDNVLTDRIVEIVQNNEIYEKLSCETISKFDKFCDIGGYSHSG